MQFPFSVLVSCIIFQVTASQDWSNATKLVNFTPRSSTTRQRVIRSPLFDTYYGNVAAVGNTNDNNQGVQFGQLAKQTAVSQSKNENTYNDVPQHPQPLPPYVNPHPYPYLSSYPLPPALRPIPVINPDPFSRSPIDAEYPQEVQGANAIPNEDSNENQNPELDQPSGENPGMNQNQNVNQNQQNAPQSITQSSNQISKADQNAKQIMNQTKNTNGQQDTAGKPNADQHQSSNTSQKTSENTCTTCTTPTQTQNTGSCAPNGTPCNYLGIGGYTNCCSSFCLQRTGESQGRCANH